MIRRKKKPIVNDAEAYGEELRGYPARSGVNPEWSKEQIYNQLISMGIDVIPGSLKISNEKYTHGSLKCTWLHKRE